MKKTLFCIVGVLLLLSNLAKAQVETIVIGQINATGVSFVADPLILASDWQTFNTASPEIGACTISSVNFWMDSGEYYLVASGTQAGSPIKSTIHLNKTPGGCLYIGGVDLTLTCTTSACASETLGCVPKNTACTPCSNGGKCSKAASNKATAIFPSVLPSTCSN